MEYKLKESGLSPVTKEWLKTLSQNYRRETQQVPIIKRKITRGLELPEDMDVRRPYSQCPVDRPQTPSAEHHCICQRPKTALACHKCDFRYVGRVRRTCPAHPRTFFLMDLSQCPNCLAIEEMVEENAEDFN